MEILRESRLDSLVIKVQGHSVANEILSTRFETEFLIDRLHAVSVKIDA